MKKKKKGGAQSEQLHDRRGNVLFLSGCGLLANANLRQAISLFFNFLL